MFSQVNDIGETHGSQATVGTVVAVGRQPWAECLSDGRLCGSPKLWLYWQMNNDEVMNANCAAPITSETRTANGLQCVCLLNRFTMTCAVINMVASHPPFSIVLADLRSKLRLTSMMGFVLLLELLLAAASPASAQNMGDWRSAAAGYWTAGTNWQKWNGSAWVKSSGSTPGTSYPSTNTTKVTLLNGSKMTNSSSTSTIIVDELTVQAGASLILNKTAMTVSHNAATAYDWDVSGSLGLNCSTAGSVVLSNNAVIAIESGGAMTNYSGAAADAFTGPGYDAGAIQFLPGSLFVLTGAKAGSIPNATWNTGSTALFAPSAPGAYFPNQFTNQVYYNFIWNWPTQNGKVGGTINSGNVTVNGTFAVYNANNQIVEDIPGSGGTLTVGNLAITNVLWYPTATNGTATVNVAGNFIVDSTATMRVNNTFGTCNVAFDGNKPQLLAIYGTNASPYHFNWIVGGNSIVYLDSDLAITGWTNGGGSLTDNGSLDLEGFALDATNLSGSGTVTNSTGASSLTVSGGLFSGVLAGGAGSIALTKDGPGILSLSGMNTYGGGTTISNGTLALIGSGSIPNTPNISIDSGAAFDLSGLTSTFTLGPSQTLTGGSTGTIAGSVSLGSGALALFYTSGAPALTVTNGSFTLNNNAVTLTVSGGTPLGVGSYQLISLQPGGSVAGSVVSSTLTVNGAGITGNATAALQLNSSGLYLVVSPSFATATIISSSTDMESYGASVTFTSSTSPAPPDGEMVTFMDGASLLGTSALSDGTAAFNTSILMVGLHSITATYAGDGIYLASGSSVLTNTVTPATLTYVANSAIMTYGSGVPALSGLVGGFVGTDTQASATTGILAFTTTAGPSNGPGSYPIIGSGLTANNYTFAQAVGNGTALTINALPVSLTGTRAYDGTTTVSAGILSVANKIGSDDVTVALGSGTLAGSNVGSEAISSLGTLALGGTSVGNYTFSGASGWVNITAVALAVTNLLAVDKVYDGTTNATLDATNAGLEGVLNGDSVTLVASNAIAYFADKTVGTNKPVTVTGLALGGVAATNYAVVNPTNLTASITPAGLTVSGLTAVSKVYDGTTNAQLSGDAALEGEVNGDEVSLVTNEVAAAFAGPNAGMDIPVTVSGYALAGVDADNYTLTQPTGLAADILPLVNPFFASSAISRGAEGWQVSFSVQAGQTFRVLVGGDLSLPLSQWSVLTNGTSGADTVTVTDNSTNLPDRFYLIVSP